MQVDIFQHLVIDPFKWLPQNYRMIFPLIIIRNISSVIAFKKSL